MTPSVAFTLVGTLVATVLVAMLEYQSRQNVVSIGFWFGDDVTFEVHDTRRLGGPIGEAERARIQEVARAEVVRAFAPFRVRVTQSSDAFYRVRVQQALIIKKRYAAAGQSNVLGPLGGMGAVGFVTLAAQAMSYAPPGTPRDQVIDAIGRGIGRAAVHEFAHQILPKGPMHISQDRASYEFWSSDRLAQYYGDMHWSVARDALTARLGR